ncbi:MAG: hypothetical protein ABJZ55_25455 [Fuerstiella sp.]
MEARILRCSLIFVSLFISTGAVYQTRNFTVTAPTSDEAKRVGEAAEEYRRDLAQFWLGSPLPPWGKPCTIRVKTGSLGAGGETRFQFVGKEVLNWNMYVQGSLERILDSVLPHEVNHTIFACHYRRPLPRWADEGAATLFEHRSEQLKQLGLLNQVIRGDREFIPMDQLLRMKEYPKGMRAMLIMYAEGYALADFLVQQGGRDTYLKFLNDGDKMGWSEAIRTNYHHGGVESLEKNWKGWILAGMPRLYVPEGQNVASITRVVSSVQGAARPTILDLYKITPTVRLQSPDERVSKSNQPTVRRSSNQTSTADVSNGGRLSDNRLPTSRTSESGAPYRMAANPEAGQSESLPHSRPRRHRSEIQAPQPRSSLTASRRSQDLGLTAGHTVQAGRSSAAGRGATASQPAASQPAASPPAASRLPSSRSQFSRPVKSTRNNRQALSQPLSQPMSQPMSKPDRYQATGFDESIGRNKSARKHLSRERSVISGSIPQWAGFPRQKELF